MDTKLLTGFLVDHKLSVLGLLAKYGHNIALDDDRSYIWAVTDELIFNPTFSAEFMELHDEISSFSNALPIVGAVVGALGNLGSSLFGKIGEGKQREHELAMAQQQLEAGYLQALADKQKGERQTERLIIGATIVGAGLVAYIFYRLVFKKKK